MTVTGENFTIYRGQDLVITCDVDADITGWTLEATFRSRETDEIALTVAGVITSAATGVFTVTLTDTQTGALPTGLYSWSAWRTNDGSENPLTTGVVTVTSTSRE